MDDSMDDMPDRDEGTGDAGDPAQAFEALRAEVAALRRAVAALPAALQENRPVDYSPDLGRIVKSLSAVGSHLAAIEAHPALRLTPARYGHEIEQAGRGLLSKAVAELLQATQSFAAERRQLTEAIGTVRRKQDQAWWLIALAVFVFGMTLLGAPVWLGELPFGWNTGAASIVMRNNSWDAGSALMQVANPQGWQDFVAASDLVRENQTAIAACQKAAENADADRRCTIIVKAR